MTNGPVSAGPSHLVTNARSLVFSRKGEEEKTNRQGDAAQVDISIEARHLQKVVALAQHDDELRLAKANKIKTQIVQGTYHVAAVEVAKSIVRSDIVQLLEKR